MHESPRVAAWLDAATVSADDTEAPLFQHVDRGGTPLSARLVRRIIKHRCAAAGVEGYAAFLFPPIHNFRLYLRFQREGSVGQPQVQVQSQRGPLERLQSVHV